MAARRPLNGRHGLEMGANLCYWPFQPLSQNKFFDPSIPSMRKGRNGEEKNAEKKLKTNQNSEITSL